MNNYQPRAVHLSTHGLRRSITALVGGLLLVATVAACTPISASGPATSVPTSVSVAVTSAAPAAQPSPSSADVVATQAASAPATATTAGSSTTAPSSDLATATQAPTATAAADPTATAQSQASQAAAATKLNLNTASPAEILKVPGVGNQMLREFQEYKPYTSILQFRREIGKYVDAQTVAAYEQYVYVPISINSADAATLQQIPGLDATEATALIASRPYDSSDAFLARLAQFVSPADLAAAKTYLSNS